MTTPDDTRTTSVIVPSELSRRLKIAAIERGMTLQAIVREGLEEHLRRLAAGEVATEPRPPARPAGMQF